MANDPFIKGSIWLVINRVLWYLDFVANLRPVIQPDPG